MKTIIQTIGPLYGEPINGSVFGQPNGSVAVPLEAKFEVMSDNTQFYNRIYSLPSGAIVTGKLGDSFTRGGAVRLKPVVKVSVAGYKVQVSEQSDFSTIFAESKPILNLDPFWIIADLKTSVWSGTNVIANGTTYYVRAVCFAPGGEALFVSDTYSFEGYKE